VLLVIVRKTVETFGKGENTGMSTEYEYSKTRKKELTYSFTVDVNV